MLQEIDTWIESSGERVPFPVEVRFAAADDLWLSTAHGRDTAYVAVHQYVRLPYARYFAAVERIVAQVAGRPHWGKMHWLEAERLGAALPAVRRRPARPGSRPTPTASSATRTSTGCWAAGSAARRLRAGVQPAA